MTALADYIEERKRHWGLMPIWALCPVRGCLSFAPVGRHCGAHWVRDLVLNHIRRREIEDSWERFRTKHGAP